MTASCVGVLGGTFDPIHYGHLAAASEVADQLDLERVVFVPAGQPWQKSGQPYASARDRHSMTVLATEDNPKFLVDTCDIDRPGPTYAVDTLRDLRATYGLDTQLYFIVGADALEQLPTWRDPGAVVAAARMVAVSRPGHTARSARFPARSVTEVEIPALDISSTEIRRRVASGRTVRYLLPDAVRTFILKHGLYREAP